jgi:RNA polymerase sigma-70 factor (ECF subfamily)
MTDPADDFYRRVLVLRCQAGDAAAFAELIELYQPRLRYFVQKMTQRSSNVDDLLQDVWLDVLRGLARLRQPGAFSGWLYRIARNRVSRQRSEPFHPLEDADIPDDEDESFGAEDAEMVHHALDQLAPAHREVLLLRFVEEMSYEEIAEVTSQPVGTVRSRIHYAKRTLRSLMERTSEQ